MSSDEELQEVSESVPVQEELPLATESPAPAKVELPEVEVGYVVGLKPDGAFVFEVLGDKPGLVQLLGLHKYAEHRLDVAKDINQGYGVPLLAQQLTQVQQILKVLLNMATEQSKSSLIKPAR